MDEKHIRYLFEHEVNTTPKKIVVEDVIFEKQYDGEDRSIPFGDFSKGLLPTDEIYIQRDEGYQSENNSWDPFTKIIISRARLETEEEQEIRLERSRLFNEKRKEDRYNTYLKFKEEFEPQNINESEKDIIAKTSKRKRV